MPRFPKARRKNNSISVFEQAHRFYGQPFEVTSSRELADSMAEWADLAPAERTFTLTHLLYLNLMAQAGTHLLLRKVWDAVEDLADELEDQADDDRDDDRDDDGHDDDGEPDDDGDEPQEDDLEEDDGAPAEAPGAPPGVTIPAAVTPPVDDGGDDLHDEEDDGYEPDDLDDVDEHDEGDER